MSIAQAINDGLTPLSGVDDCQAAVDLIGDAEFALLVGSVLGLVGVGGVALVRRLQRK